MPVDDEQAWLEDMFKVEEETVGRMTQVDRGRMTSAPPLAANPDPDDYWAGWDEWEWDDPSGIKIPKRKPKKPKWRQSRQAIIGQLQLDYDHSGLLLDANRPGNGSLGWAESIRANAFHDAIGYCLNKLEEVK